MDLKIESKVLQTVEQGLLLQLSIEDLSVQAYVVIAPADLSLVEKLIPLSVFESDSQVHVGSITDEGDHVDQVLQIIENMEPDDVAVYLCEGTVAYAQALSVLGAIDSDFRSA
jgi:hypothetical protein